MGCWLDFSIHRFHSELRQLSRRTWGTLTPGYAQLHEALPTINSQLLVKLTDFGIGQVVSEEVLAGVTKVGFTQTLVGSDSSSHTGTQLYMAPELLAGKPASTRSDIYSLGVVLLQLIVGDFSQPVTTDWEHSINDPLLREDLKRCFAGHPEERFSGARQLADNLRNLRNRRRRREEALKLARHAEQRHRVAVLSCSAAVALLLLAAALGYGLWRAQAAGALTEANIYAADMNLAQEALLADDLGKARALLARYRPGTGREHLRGFECVTWPPRRAVITAQSIIPLFREFMVSH